jgi:hypothetical protein
VTVSGAMLPMRNVVVRSQVESLLSVGADAPWGVGPGSAPEQFVRLWPVSVILCEALSADAGFYFCERGAHALKGTVAVADIVSHSLLNGAGLLSKSWKSARGCRQSYWQWDGCVGVVGVLLLGVKVD